MRTNQVDSMLTSMNAGMSLKAETKYYTLFYQDWCVRDTVIELGEICACILALYQISKGAPIGNFVMLISYWGNFTGNSFALITVGSAPSNLIKENLPVSRMFRANSIRTS